jgi:transcriptional regulator with XRE-family HTH domain
MKDPINLHIGQRVRHRRFLTGLTQQKLAQAVGVRFQQIQKYECAANGISAARLWQIAQALDVSVTFFYSDFGGLDGAHQAGDAEADLLQRKETADLLRALNRLDDRTRRQFLMLVRTLDRGERNRSAEDVPRGDGDPS